MEKIIIPSRSESFNREVSEVLREAIEDAKGVRFEINQDFCYVKNGHNFYFDDYGCKEPSLKEYQYWPNDTDEPEILLLFKKDNTVPEVISSETPDWIDQRVHELRNKLREEEEVSKKTKAEIHRLTRLMGSFNLDYHAIVPTEFQSLSEWKSKVRGNWSAKNWIYKNRVLARQVWLNSTDYILNYHVVKLSEEEVQGIVVQNTQEVCSE